MTEQQQLVEAMDSGPWEAGVTTDGLNRHFVQSQDFTFDVRLYISGDFPADTEAKYAAWLADTLNAKSNPNSQAPDGVAG